MSFCGVDVHPRLAKLEAGWPETPEAAALVVADRAPLFDATKLKGVVRFFLKNGGGRGCFEACSR